MQLLTPTGQRVATGTGREIEAHVADVTVEDLLGLYADMVIIRRLDDEATALQRQGELGLWAPLRGQEAAQVGSARALAPGDMAFPSYREHGVAYCRGVDPVAVLGLFRGVSHGGWDPAEHGFALYAIVVGAQTLHATGYAMGVSRDGGACATITYFGDGAASQGDVSEAFGWAAVFGAPVVFFCQNNQYAISQPASAQSRVPVAQRAQGHGFPGLRVDGNDVLATLAATRWALGRARAGDGPTLIEAVTYRMGAHTTADDPTRYRDAAEVARWAVLDPIARVRAHLIDTGALDEAGDATLAARADDFAADLRRRCLALQDPAPLTIFDHVTIEESRLLTAERADLADLLATGAEGAGPGSDHDPYPTERYPAEPYPAEPSPGGGAPAAGSSDAPGERNGQARPTPRAALSLGPPPVGPPPPEPSRPEPSRPGPSSPEPSSRTAPIPAPATAAGPIAPAPVVAVPAVATTVANPGTAGPTGQPRADATWPRGDEPAVPPRAVDPRDARPRATDPRRSGPEAPCPR
jgi:pyruvate dehydrogenase E1 component alpha subunit